MTPDVDSDERGIVAILIGAQEYPEHSSLNNAAFGRSSAAILRYLQDELSLRSEQILNLFDDFSNVIDLDNRIEGFLSKNPTSQSVLVFYTGHGGFLSDREYYLTVRSTRKGKEHTTGLRIKVLAETLNQFAFGKKLFLVLDCCFAGEAIKTFQSVELATLVENKTFDAFPQAGTALLVAASKDEPAISPLDKPLTMFSEALLDVLYGGVQLKRMTLTLNDVAIGAQAYIKSKYGQTGVRPEVHSPRQTGMDVASFPVFPNRAFNKRMPVKLSARLSDDDLDKQIRGQLEDIRNRYVVSNDVVSEAMVELTADVIFDVEDGLLIVSGINEKMKALDHDSVPIRRGNLILRQTAGMFWRSVFEEAQLQGHRTLGLLLSSLTSRGQTDLKNEAIAAIYRLVADFEFQNRRK